MTHRDARTLPIVLAAGGRERKQWRDAVAAFKVSDFPDFAAPGPRTASWCVNFLNRSRGGPRDHHRWWRSNLKLEDKDHGQEEHDLAMLALELAAC